MLDLSTPVDLYPLTYPQTQTLKQGIRRVLSSCENRGFGSIAFPVLGTGMVLKFPYNIAARVLLQEIQGHQQTRTSRTPFLIRIVVHPNDKEAFKVKDYPGKQLFSLV